MTFIDVNGRCEMYVIFNECAWYASAGGIAPKILWLLMHLDPPDYSWTAFFRLVSRRPSQLLRRTEPPRWQTGVLSARSFFFWLCFWQLCKTSIKMHIVLKKDVTGMNEWMEWNEMHWHEMEWNRWNWMERNGMEWNRWNWMERNGIESMKLNGMEWNCMNKIRLRNAWRNDEIQNMQTRNEWSNERNIEWIEWMNQWLN